MAVPVVNIGEVRVRMVHFLVKMRMGMRLLRVNSRRVRVAVMFVVRVLVRMLHRLVMVPMFVALRQVKPNTDAHQNARTHKQRPNGFTKQKQRNESAHKGGE